MDLSQYDYQLPPELIAQAPAEPRDSARLFVYDTAHDKITLDIFKNVPKYLPRNSLLVFNDTKVLPARLFLKKETGGKVEVLLMVNEGWEAGLVKGIVDRKVEVGGKLYFDPERYLEIVKQDENIFYFRPNFLPIKLPYLLNRFGQTPLPKYIKGKVLAEPQLRSRYQTIFAKNPASIAAPTASFHFTRTVFQKLKKAGHAWAFVTLHVGLGTFASLTPENIKQNLLHKEFYKVHESERKKISEAKFAHRPVVGVGTTAVRTLESLAATDNLSGETRLFIHPPYEFKTVDAIITNFHVPKSSLMMLVQAMLESKQSKRKLVDLYDIAIREKFRFYSFGDSMLII